MPRLSFNEAATDTVTKPATVTETKTATAPAPVKAAEDAATYSAVVPAQSYTPATLPVTYFEDDDAAGEIMDDRYSAHPSLKIVSKTSALAEEFGIGTWVLGSKTIDPVAIGKMDTPLLLVCMKFAMAWQEQVTYGEQRMPQMFVSLKEALDAGFTNEWNHPTLPRVAEVVKALFFIPRPEGVDAPHIFSIESPEGMGTLAWFFAARTAFGTVGKTLIQAKRSFLSPDKGGMKSGLWTLTASKAARNGNTWLLPKIAPKGKVSPALTEFLRSLA
jgi:hypothetical protein